MCKLGDIIVIKKYKDRGNNLSRHSFVVIDDEPGAIRGLSYDLVCNVMSSFKSKEQKKRKLRFLGNFPIVNEDTVTDPDDGKDGYIKSEQFYYFNKEKIDYIVIGSMSIEAFNNLIDYIENLKIDIEEITDNL